MKGEEQRIVNEIVQEGVRRVLMQIAERAFVHTQKWLCAYHLRRKNDANLPRFVEVFPIYDLENHRIAFVLRPHKHEAEKCESCADTDNPPFPVFAILDLAGKWYDETKRSNETQIDPEEALLLVRWDETDGIPYFSWTARGEVNLVEFGYEHRQQQN